MSVSKSVVALAIGFAIDEGALNSINEPVCSFFPLWKKGKKAKITIKNLLNHTSGIQAKKTCEDIYLHDSCLKHALNAKLVSVPGERFFYNNRAINILPGIIQKVTGMRMDAYLKKKLFKRLNISDSDWFWQLDKSGSPYGMSGLYIRPAALAKIGLLILQKGGWNGHQIISRKWLEEMTSPGQKLNSGCGYLWWLKSNPQDDRFFFDENLISLYKNAGVSSKSIKKLQPMVGRMFTRQKFRRTFVESLGSLENAQKFLNEISKLGLPDGKIKQGPISTWLAEGYLGQYLVIIPSKKLVGVRLIDQTSAGSNTNFKNFPMLLQDL